MGLCTAYIEMNWTFYGQSAFLGLFIIILLYLKNTSYLEQQYDRTVINTHQETPKGQPQNDLWITMIQFDNELQFIQASEKGLHFVDTILSLKVQMVDKQTRMQIPTFHSLSELKEHRTVKQLIIEILKANQIKQCQILSLRDESYLIDIYFSDIITLVITDIHEYKQFVCKQQSQTTMKQLFKSFSHEFNTSLNYILALAQVAEENPAIPLEFREQYCVPIINSVTLMNCVVADIMDYNSFLSKTFDLSIQTFDLELLIKDVIRLFEHQLSYKKLTLVFRKQIFDKVILSDRQRIKQILINLINNSQKFTLQGGIIIKVDQFQDKFTFHVQDSGIGMTVGELALLRNLLSGGANMVSVSKNSVGFGLGLFISNKIAEKLSSSKSGLQFESNNGFHIWFTIQNFQMTPVNVSMKTPMVYIKSRGSIDTRQQQVHRARDINIAPMISRFSGLLGKEQHKMDEHYHHISKKEPSNKTLKIAKELLSAVSSNRQIDEEMLVNQECEIQPIRHSKKSCKCPRILIVDDEQINIMALSMLLEQFALASDSLFNGLECLNLMKTGIKKTHCTHCKDQQYTLIFMDINMPIMDGLTASDLVKEVSNKVIIIACTAFVDNETKNQCYLHHMDYYLAKPVKRSQLAEVLNFYNIIQ